MNQRQFVCPKCNSSQYEVDEMRATGGQLAKLFDVQNKKFTMVSCTNCGYTELYKRKTSGVGNVVDFLFGG